MINGPPPAMPPPYTSAELPVIVLERIVVGRPTEGTDPGHPLDEVVAYINRNVLGDTQLTALDMLDALASTGTCIVSDPDGHSMAIAVSTS